MESTKIDITSFHRDDDHSMPAFLIFRAMVNSLVDKNEHVNAKFNMKEGDSMVEVELKVNGVPVDIVQALAQTWRLADDNIDKRARQMALEMVTSAGLEKLRIVMEDAEIKIRNALGILDEAP